MNNFYRDTAPKITPEEIAKCMNVNIYEEHDTKKPPIGKVVKIEGSKVTIELFDKDGTITGQIMKEN